MYIYTIIHIFLDIDPVLLDIDPVLILRSGLIGRQPGIRSRYVTQTLVLVLTNDLLHVSLTSNCVDGGKVVYFTLVVNKFVKSLSLCRNVWRVWFYFF